jgi:hypothetical protein
MTDREYQIRNYDTHSLLGAAAHLVRAMADGEVTDIVHRMAQEWTDAYRRYQAGDRAALPWVTDLYPEKEEVR